VGPTSQQLLVDEQRRSGIPLGRLPSQPIFKLRKCEGSSAGPPTDPSREELTQRLCKEWKLPDKLSCRGLVSRPGRPSMSSTSEVLECGEQGPSSLGFLRALTGKQYRRCGVLRKRVWDVQVPAQEISVRKMLLADNSGSVVMKVDFRYGVCNNSPAEASSSENG